MENLNGGGAYACGAMVFYGIAGLGMAIFAGPSLIGMAGALALGAAMMDSADSCYNG